MRPAPPIPEYAEPVPTLPEPEPVASPGPLQDLVTRVRRLLGGESAKPGVSQRAAPPPAPMPAAKISAADVSLERGIADIRRTDRGFEPARFTGYASMTFRAVQDAWTARDLTPIRDRLTPELYGALQTRCDRLRETHRVNRIEHVDVAATVTEAWQEGDRDYVTAHVSGVMTDYTIDADTGTVLKGSATTERAVEEFWTFTRPAGLNAWMLSAIQT